MPSWFRRLVTATRQGSLVVKFGWISLLLMLTIGIGLGQLLRTSVERQAFRSAISEAEVIVRLKVQPELDPANLQTGLTPEQQRFVQLALRDDFARLNVIDAVVWNLDSSAIFATNQNSSALEATAGATQLDAYQRARDGTPSIRVVDVQDDATMPTAVRRQGVVLEVFQPLRFGTAGIGASSGVVRTTVPYQPIADAINSEVTTLFVALGVALLALYAVLFRLVANASAKLRRQAEENEWQANHDALTGLANRKLFQRSVAIDLSRNAETALLLIDLDGFKEINDTLGHQHGDLLLVEVAHRLTNAIGNQGLVARLGGDEFAVLLRNACRSRAELLASDLVKAIEAPLEIGGLEIRVGSSVGVALAPEHGTDHDTLLQRADIAMYAAKRSSDDTAVYNASLDHTNKRQLALSGSLRRGLDERELEVHYQPKVQIEDGTIVGFEALVRWNHPSFGLLTPDKFIALFGRAGLMPELTDLVLSQAMEQLRSWLDRGLDLHMAVNVSAESLQSDQLGKSVDRALMMHQITPDRLVLEITESTIGKDANQTRLAIHQMRQRGVRVAIDDFGTGYSSLALLSSLPVNELKIDRQFIRDLRSDRGVAIVEYSIELARRFDLTVVAEGVERSEELSILRRLQCDVAQGYLYSKPLDADAISTWMKHREALPLPTR